MRNNRLHEDKDWDFMNDVEITDSDIKSQILRNLDYDGNIDHLRKFLNGGTLEDLKNYINSVGEQGYEYGIDSGYESATYDMYSQDEMDDQYNLGREEGREEMEEELDSKFEEGFGDGREEGYKEGKKYAYEKMWQEAYEKGYQAGEDRGYTDYLETVDKDVDYGYDDEDFDEHQ